jgi:NTP pyrophosphatase (non-canonical NTP hydrolase)
MEECGEVIQEAAKIMRFGQQPENLVRFEKEIGDLQCMIDLCQEYDLVSFTNIEKYAEEKREKLKQWSEIV